MYMYTLDDYQEYFRPAAVRAWWKLSKVLSIVTMALVTVDQYSSMLAWYVYYVIVGQGCFVLSSLWTWFDYETSTGE